MVPGAAEVYGPITKVEIDLQALAHNCRELRRLTSPHARMMAVVKADAYGHGAIEVARTALLNGAEYLAVARPSEAVNLREAGIRAPILLFGYTSPGSVEYMVRNSVTSSINTVESAEALSREGERLGKKVRAHIKVDTGMGRLGIVCDGLTLRGPGRDSRKAAAETILRIARMPGLDIEGIFTHFASADSADKTHAQTQFALFMEILEDLRKQSLQVKFRHAANSAALIDMPETHLDMVRPGISLYGLWPSADVKKANLELRPVMAIKSTVIQVKEVPEGFRISYGGTYETNSTTRIATVPIGYADAYSRLLSSRGSMLVHGRRAPVVGRVCMDLTLIDVGPIPQVSVGDEVVVLGCQGCEEITADEIASLTGTINYEVVSTVTARVARTFLNRTSPGDAA
jgi:alanine racemase